MPTTARPRTATLIVALEEEDLALTVKATTRLRSCLADGWWVFRTADGRELAWPQDQVSKVELTWTPDAPPE